MSKASDIIDNHPLNLLVKDYFSRYEKLRDEDQDLSNAQFHTKNALIVSGPEEWPYYHCIKSACNDFFKEAKSRKEESIIVIYPSSESYKELYEILGRDVTYLSLTEIHCAVSREKEVDARSMTKVWTLLKYSAITFVLDADDIYNVKNDVIDVIKENTNGVLVILG